MKDSIVPPAAFNMSASLAPRSASTWASSVGPSHCPVASHISCRRPSETTTYSTSHQKSENSNNALNIAIQKVVSSIATVDVASGRAQLASASEIARRKVKFLQRPRWDGFAEALPAYNGTTYSGSVLSSAPPSVRKTGKRCKFIVAPYVASGHWVLVVVDLQLGLAYEFDSMKLPKENP